MDVLVEMRKVHVTGDVGSADELLESLDHVEGLLDDMVETEAAVEVVIRLPLQMVHRLDGYVNQLNSADPAAGVTRGILVQELLCEALAARQKGR